MRANSVDPKVGGRRGKSDFDEESTADDETLGGEGEGVEDGGETVSL